MNYKEIANISLFEQLTEQDLHEISEEFEVEYFPKNSNIIYQGDYGDKIYFVLEGRVVVYVLD